MKKRVLICGSRDWTRKNIIERELNKLEPSKTLIIHGGARGVDRLAGKLAKERGIEVIVFPAEWDKYGKAAGMIRNQQMLKEGKPDLVLAFSENIEYSKGTKNMRDISEDAGVEVRVISEWE